MCTWVKNSNRRGDVLATVAWVKGGERGGKKILHIYRNKYMLAAKKTNFFNHLLIAATSWKKRHAQ